MKALPSGMNHFMFAKLDMPVAHARMFYAVCRNKFDLSSMCCAGNLNPYKLTELGRQNLEEQCKSS